MLRTHSVAELFDEYRRRVLPAAAPEIQIEECRRAFYAGSYSILMMLLATVGDQSTDEDDGATALQQLQDECEAFFEATIGTPPGPAPVVADQSSYNVRSDQIESALRDLAQLIKPGVPPGFGFTLLLFSYGRTGLRGEGKAGSLFYISSAQRDDMIKAMREFIARNVQ
jgi:hypothetical protein